MHTRAESHNFQMPSLAPFRVRNWEAALGSRVRGRHLFSPRRGSVEVSSTAFQGANSHVCESTCDFRVAARSRALSALTPRRGDLHFAACAVKVTGWGKAGRGDATAATGDQLVNFSPQTNQTRTSRAVTKTGADTI